MTILAGYTGHTDLDRRADLRAKKHWPPARRDFVEPRVVVVDRDGARTVAAACSARDRAVLNHNGWSRIDA